MLRKQTLMRTFDAGSKGKVREAGEYRSVIRPTTNALLTVVERPVETPNILDRDTVQQVKPYKSVRSQNRIYTHKDGNESTRIPANVQSLSPDVRNFVIANRLGETFERLYSLIDIHIPQVIGRQACIENDGDERWVSVRLRVNGSAKEIAKGDTALLMEWVEDASDQDVDLLRVRYIFS